MMTATYSPEDNKLRLYASSRLDSETYARVHAAGFIWAPKQDLFVAPMWTPAREDLLLELCGEIGDEDTSLVDRAEERADRFDTYSDKRRADAESARSAVAAIADNIPLGQPILVGHHSERHARRDAEKIENGMRRAVKMWQTSEYWQHRAAGAIRAAKYKERPDVRARRIKTLEAEKRKCERSLAEAEKAIRIWSDLFTREMNKTDGTPATNLERARFVAGRTNTTSYDIYSGLDKGTMTPEEAREQTLAISRRAAEHSQRWIAHVNNRLIYERAMLDEQGAAHLLAPKPKKVQPPLLNYRAAAGSIQSENRYNRGQVVTYSQREMTQAAYAKVPHDYKGTCESLDKSHRFRIAMAVYTGGPRDHSYVAVYLTDAKTHPEPTPGEAKPREIPEPRPLAIERQPTPQRAPDPLADQMQAMRATLKAGVKVVAVPQLFPTPAALAARMVELAEIQATHSILEPSAGTGALVDAILRAGTDGARITAVEINHDLAAALAAGRRIFTSNADFLECADLGQFDRIIMNPPFERGSDIEHITRAATMLRPGGRLVALCAAGPRQTERLRPQASRWEELPAGTFDGTGVRAALLVIDAPPAPAIERTDQGLQLVIPGAERSIRQAAAYREAAARGRIAPKKPQRPADFGLFAISQPKQLDIEDATS